MSEPRVINAFLRQVFADRATGKVRPLAEYQAMFPGNDALIAEQYERCRELEAGSEPDGPQRIGPFSIIREIGRGGQAVVYLAEDTRLGRRVAIKVLSGIKALTSGALERLLREARIASRLDHPGICAVHEAGVEGGLPYIVMQLIEGTTLAKRIATTREGMTPARASDALASEAPAVEAPAQPEPLDRAAILEAVGLVEKAARALHAAHEAGIVHRDVKPGNIMITPLGEAVVLDFGFAWEDDPELSSLTRSEDLFGTPAYMSP